MPRRFDWASPSSRMVLSAALDALSEVGYGERTLPDIRARAGAAGELVEESDLLELVATALERVRVFTPPEPTGDLRADLAVLLRPWLARPGRDELAVAAVLSAGAWEPRLGCAVLHAFDRPLTQAVGALLAGAVADGRVAVTRVHTLNWLLRGLALDRLRGGQPRCPVDLEELVDHLIAGLGPGRRPG
ncbi:hypothetical protein [Geodermatophilus sp. DSM 44513]|uniref:hypothetical protein n=1 Tax=Geodermatophilus sp. DSM 44513 TaxID=1528104 RepID=UPI001287C8D9|nr:hypothetical protein [Geodermatophilus sp. DSM 44513]WNV76818.1 hypothetical protein RTG05_05955 [Geodermatophilus sp. DSM 44513]